MRFTADAARLRQGCRKDSDAPFEAIEDFQRAIYDMTLRRADLLAHSSMREGGLVPYELVLHALIGAAAVLFAEAGLTVEQLVRAARRSYRRPLVERPGAPLTGADDAAEGRPVGWLH